MMGFGECAVRNISLMATFSSQLQLLRCSQRGFRTSEPTSQSHLKLAKLFTTQFKEMSYETRQSV